MLKVLRAKLHRIRVTGANLNYHGSITLDPELCDRVGILPLEFVDIWNTCSGARIETYVIHGDPGSRCCILNGAAARTCQAGDPIIIAASDLVAHADASCLVPRVLTFDEANDVISTLQYEVYADGRGNKRVRTTNMSEPDVSQAIARRL